MEPIDPTRLVMIVNTTVVRVEEIFRQVYVSGIGKDTVFRKVSRGWFVLFDGSYEAIHFGFDKPDLKEGDEVEISFKKVEHERPLEAA